MRIIIFPCVLILLSIWILELVGLFSWSLAFWSLAILHCYVISGLVYHLIVLNVPSWSPNIWDEVQNLAIKGVTSNKRTGKTHLWVSQGRSHLCAFQCGFDFRWGRCRAYAKDLLDFMCGNAMWILTLNFVRVNLFAC